MRHFLRISGVRQPQPRQSLPSRRFMNSKDCVSLKCYSNWKNMKHGLGFICSLVVLLIFGLLSSKSH